MILEMIGIASIGALWITSEPTIRLRELILGKHDGVLRRLLECAMCSTFYIAMIYSIVWLGSFDLLFISTTSILAELVSRKLNSGSI